MKGSSNVSLRLVFGIVGARLILLPIIGIFVVKGALYLGFVHADPLYIYVLLLQFALPPSMNIGTWLQVVRLVRCFFLWLLMTDCEFVDMVGTITQLFGAGESECSVIMMWSYGLASVSLTVWSMFFMWLVAWFGSIRHINYSNVKISKGHTKQRNCVFLHQFHSKLSKYKIFNSYFFSSQ